MSKLTKSSKGSNCIRCGCDDAYSCHFNGTYQHQYGKGRGIKAHDMATAEFCYSCDQMFSEGVMGNWQTKDERDAEFLHWITMTNIRRFNNGILKC